MRTAFYCALLCLCGCHKKNDLDGGLPPGSTSTEILVNFPDGRIFRTSDFDTPVDTSFGGYGYTINGSSFITDLPVAYVVDKYPDSSMEYYYYCFYGGRYFASTLYQLYFSTPPSMFNSSCNEWLSSTDPLNYAMASSFYFEFEDTIFLTNEISIVINDPNQMTPPFTGGIQVTFNVDSVICGNKKIAYPTSGPMAISGSFSGLGFQ
jgi:hypothetical protein